MVLFQFCVAHTVRDVITMFRQDGIEFVTNIGLNHPSDLEAYRVSIIEEFTKYPPTSAKEAAARIEQLTSLKRSEQRVRVISVFRVQKVDDVSSY
ncbi:MAG: hypothetical protein LBI18_02360 [Planctomycetaceae bacterium]|nr:hypothetical protein [Planctomycetaceae bacterium]